MWSCWLLVVFASLGSAWRLHTLHPGPFYRKSSLSNFRSDRQGVNDHEFHFYGGRPQSSKAYERTFDNILLSGLVSKQRDVMELESMLEIHNMRIAKEMQCIVDDIPFARKRIVSPSTVYSGLTEISHLHPSIDEFADKLQTGGENPVNAWLAMDVHLAQLPQYTDIAISFTPSLSRSVFTIPLTKGEMETHNSLSSSLFRDALSKMERANISATILTYSVDETLSTKREGGREGELSGFCVTEGFKERVSVQMGTDTQTGEVAERDVVRACRLRRQDILRVLVHSLPMSFTCNKHFHIASGDLLDLEMHVYMQSRGFSVDSQVHMLLDGAVERVREGICAEMEKERQRVRKTGVPR